MKRGRASRGDGGLLEGGGGAARRQRAAAHPPPSSTRAASIAREGVSNFLCSRSGVRPDRWPPQERKNMVIATRGEARQYRAGGQLRSRAAAAPPHWPHLRHQGSPHPPLSALGKAMAVADTLSGAWADRRGPFPLPGGAATPAAQRHGGKLGEVCAVCEAARRASHAQRRLLGRKRSLSLSLLRCCTAAKACRNVYLSSAAAGCRGGISSNCDWAIGPAQQTPLFLARLC